MNKAYIFLLKKRYGEKWNTLKNKIGYYLDFSIVYIIFLGFFFFLFYKSIWYNPPVILQGIATLLNAISSNFWITISILLLFGYSIKGLTTPLMHYDAEDTYFLFILPIPKAQYILIEWLFQHFKNAFMIFLLVIIIAPVFHILYPHQWFEEIMGFLLKINMLSICIINIQWLSFQLPQETKRLTLMTLRYIKILSLIALGIGVLALIWMFYFSEISLINIAEFLLSEISLLSLDFNYFPMLLLTTILSIFFSIFFMKNATLEDLKESSTRQNKIKSLYTSGMMKEAKKLGKGRNKKEKRYFLSIPGYYKDLKIFLWRNLSQFIKQPIQYLHPYGLYLSLGIGIVISTKGSSISLIFIFFALYILGQGMLLPLKEHYESNDFLSSFPIKSITILRGYLFLPLMLSTLAGLGIIGIAGWMVKDWTTVLALAMVLPFFSYYILLASIKNLLEELYFIVYGTKTLHMEFILILQGIVPIIFSFILLNKGLPLIIAVLGSVILYILMCRELEKHTIYPLQRVLQKYC